MSSVVYIVPKINKQTKKGGHKPAHMDAGLRGFDAAAQFVRFPV